jgi:predicted aldo/keto reductase-like oxidoreductase
MKNRGKVMDNKPSGISRRDFMKLIGVGAAAGVGLTALAGSDRIGNSQAKREIPTDKMTYRVDPKNGNRLSLLGYGMMRLPRVQRRRGESLPDVNDIDQEAVNELVDYAIAHGVNVFDTAPPYCKGFSEKSTGEALSRHPRDKYHISTKMSNGRNTIERERSIKMYHQSFEDLRVDYIDYYLAHNIGNEMFGVSFKERFLDNGILDFLFKEKEAGRIRSLGWSFHGDDESLEYLSGAYPWDFTLINLNYLSWGQDVLGFSNVDAQRQYEILVEKNIPAWIMGPLLGGGLSAPHYKGRELMMQANPEASAASWGLRFAGSLPNVVTVLSGMTFMDHLQDNICTYSPLVPLSDEEREMLLGDVAQVALEYRNINCTKCQYCMPCPYGLDIPEIFSHYNRSMNEGNFPDDRQSEDFKRARRAFLVGMDRSVSPLRQASRCINCNLCTTPRCPQFINIPREMRRIAEFVEELRVDV